jgi:hypothetical protein
MEWRHPGPAVPVPPAEHASGGPLASGAVALRAGVAGDPEPSRQPTTTAAASPSGSTSRSKSPACTRTAAVTPAAVMAAARQAAVRAQPVSRIG